MVFFPALLGFTVRVAGESDWLSWSVDKLSALANRGLERINPSKMDAEVLSKILLLKSLVFFIIIPLPMLLICQ
ncbi:hypothetical protein DKL56_07320 [Lactobacillus apis]|nr:hypothetical protein DKL56_07320 [Lactobacillus apis]GGG38060.1 hypothetical protein GCM10007323_10200 [Lactobacillus apis]